jgi:hypothetical protein
VDVISMIFEAIVLEYGTAEVVGIPDFTGAALTPLCRDTTKQNDVRTHQNLFIKIYYI